MELHAAKKTKKLDFSKETVNVIRTTLRNYIELTAIADNKANVLLSLNALMVAGVVPIALSNLQYVIENLLYVPLIILSITSFATIYMSTMVLAPMKFDIFNSELPDNIAPSPFFFGTVYEIQSLEAYFDYLQAATERKDTIRQHLSQDMYYIGRRLGEKMALIRQSFRVFRVGIFLTLLATALVFVL
ncbi:MAG: Pycsar system effector family protein [Bacteroidota bacterium]